MLKDKPITIDYENWYYEEEKGVCFVHEVRNKNGEHIRTDQFVVPWKKLLESVHRKYPLENE